MVAALLKCKYEQIHLIAKIENIYQDAEFRFLSVKR